MLFDIKLIMYGILKKDISKEVDFLMLLKSFGTK